MVELKDLELLFSEPNETDADNKKDSDNKDVDTKDKNPFDIDRKQEYKPNDYQWTDMKLDLISKNREYVKKIAADLWKNIYSNVNFDESNNDTPNDSDIINEGLFSRHLSITKIDEKHYRIDGLFNKEFVSDVKHYIENGNRLLIMFEIITQRKFMFFKKTYVDVHEFFIPELYTICVILYNKSKKDKYKVYANDIKANTWLSKPDPKYKVKLDISKLQDLKYTPKDFQLKFIKEYPIQKYKLQMRGAILALDQGLGKTFTSLTLMHLLNKDVVIIICPKTLLSGWRDEIKNIFIDPPKDNEIYVVGYNETITKKLKYIIVNYEKIPLALNIVKSMFSGKNIGLIVDECQNFKDIKTKRSQQLITLTDTIKPSDVLLLSGTPIKNNYYEFATYLRVIDPKFDDEALSIFEKIFKTNKAIAHDVVKYRFEMIAFRRMKEDVTKLPEKKIIDYKVRISNEKDYYITTVKEEIKKEYEKLFAEESKNVKKYMDEIFRIVEQAKSLCPDISKYADEYIKLIKKNKDGLLIEIMPPEVSKKVFECEEYIEKCLKSKDKKLYKQFKDLKVKVRSLSLSVFGRVVGKILSDKRYKMVIDIFSQNITTVCKMIKDSTKTVIFTYSKKAVDKLAEIIRSKCGVEVVTMKGEDKDRKAIIDKFKHDENVKVFIATYQVASVGLTLIEADTMIYADKPYRIEDLRQAHDRIYRIGQDKPVKIYYLKLEAKEPTIQERIDEIVNYYKEITGKVISYKDLEKNIK